MSLRSRAAKAEYGDVPQAFGVEDEYELGKLLYSGTWGRVHVAIRRSDAREVVLKTYERSTNGAACARREYETLQALSHPGLPRAIEWIDDPVRPALALELLPGISMAAWVQARLPSIQDFLHVANQLAAILDAIHQLRILHRDVTPANILIEPGTRRAFLIDFGIAIRLGAATPTAAGSERVRHFEGTARYVAPEQTGKINHGCDFRTDLYALGGSLYFALTGRPPLDGSTRDELIHAHIARIPVAPSELRPEIPGAVSRLVEKLLRKEPAERYQSARALRSDLCAMAEELERRGEIDPEFALGMDDAPDRPRFPARLHGREVEIQRLRDAYDSALEGKPRALFLHGASGVGKSSLMDTLRPLLGDRGAYLAQGKFDAYREDAHGGWVLALESLAEQMLAEGDARLEQWRDALRSGLGSIARALVDVVPELEFVLGTDLPAVPALGAREAQGRLALALERFVRACATTEHPLVLFLDDLQWIDAGSRFLLESLLESEESLGAFLFVGTYRSSDVDARHPLRMLIDRLSGHAIGVEELELGALDTEAACEMVASALGRSCDEVRSLTERIERQVGTGPLMIRQFIEHLHERGLLGYDRGAWRWDADKVAAAPVPESAVELITAKLARLDRAAHEALQFASCMSHEFDARLLSELGGPARAELEPALDALSEAGLIVPSRGGFRFAHDRLREVVNAELSEAARSAIHFRTGSLLLERLTPTEIEARIFEIADHLGRGHAHVSEALRLEVIETHVRAGSQALKRGAVAQASTFLRAAHALFSEDDWAGQRALGIRLHHEYAECALQGGELERVPALMDALAPHVRSEFELALVEIKRLRVRMLVDQPEECARYTLQVLRRFGIRWPLRPSRLRAWIAMRRVQWCLRGRSSEQLLRPGSTPDPRTLSILLILNASGAARARSSTHSTALSISFALRYFARHGYVTPPGFALAGYAAYASLIIGDRGSAERVQIARDWIERVPDPVHGPRAQMLLLTLEMRTTPRRRAIPSMARLIALHREVGDLEYAYYARFLYVFAGALGGVSVSDSHRELSELADSVKRSGYKYPEPALCSHAYGVLTRSSLNGFDLARELDLGPSDDASLRTRGESMVKSMWLMIACIHGRYDLAFEIAEHDYQALMRAVPFVHVTDHTFYRGLAAAVLRSKARGARARRLSHALRQSMRLLREWAKQGPDFAHMLTFLEAEKALLKGRASRADALFLQAATTALKQGFIHHAALAHERRAQSLSDQRRDLDAATAIGHAIGLYRQWGALAKCAQLDS